MEVHALKLSLTDADLTASAERAAPRDLPVQQLEVKVTTEGVRVKGVCMLIVKVPFETRWALSVREGKLAARLADVKVIGLGVGVLTGVLMGAVVGAAAKEDALRVEGDTVLVDADRLLARQGFLARCNLTAVRCDEGRLWIEAADGAV